MRQRQFGEWQRTPACGALVHTRHAHDSYDANNACPVPKNSLHAVRLPGRHRDHERAMGRRFLGQLTANRSHFLIVINIRDESTDFLIE
jgi:hypothetical protein